MKRFTPRARGRAGKIRKRSCHITVIVSRLDDERLETLRNARTAQAAVSRTRRVASSRRRADQQASLNKRETAAVEAAENEALEAEANANDVIEDEANETDVMEFDTVDTPVEDLDRAWRGRHRAYDRTTIEEDQPTRRPRTRPKTKHPPTRRPPTKPTRQIRTTPLRRRSNGSEGKPLRFPSRDHDGLEVALVQGARLQGPRHRGLEDPRLPDQAARECRRQSHRDRAQLRPHPRGHPHGASGHRHRSPRRRGRAPEEGPREDHRSEEQDLA